MKIDQLNKVGNRPFRDEWVRSMSVKYRNEGLSTLLDLGAGERPYREMLSDLGYIYQSHDFNKYIPAQSQQGFQDPKWDHPEHDYVCDILEMPTTTKFDVILCTEVLEHVPDPKAALERISQLLNPNGVLLLTVPLSSHIHQAPYYFSAGLSPYWFLHWCPRFDLEIDYLKIQGDYLDRIEQDLFTLLQFRKGFHIPGLSRFCKLLISKLRPLVKLEVLESSGFGTLLIARKR
jgi:SAM-dependent methyltransferase